MTFPLYYILDKDGNCIGTNDTTVFSKWQETADKTVVKTMVGPYEVSTVFLGMDHSWGNGRPILWETMIFQKGVFVGDSPQFDKYQARYTSKDAALIGHQKAVDYVRSEYENRKK